MLGWPGVAERLQVLRVEVRVEVVCRIVPEVHVDLVAIDLAAVRPKQRRGFAAMDPDRMRAVCSQGGKTAHALVMPLVTKADGTTAGTFRLTDEPIGEPPVRARAAWEAAGNPRDHLWISDLGETRDLTR